MSEEDLESPYCEVCGTCGYIGCCGIRNFIEEHIEGKTNCKNENIIINELISLCDYKDEVFKENERLHSIIKEARELIKDRAYWEEKTEEGEIVSGKLLLTDDIDDLLEILDKENENV